MDKEIRVYRHSRAEAQELGEAEEWLESYRANCICARAIDLAIKGGSSEKSIEEERVKSVLVRFGYDRVNWVLANTILYGEHGARYSEENKAWAESFPCRRPSIAGGIILRHFRRPVRWIGLQTKFVKNGGSWGYMTRVIAMRKP